MKIDMSNEEKEEWLNNVNKAIELGESAKRLINNEDFKVVFNKEDINKNLLHLCSLIGHDDNTDKQIIKKITFINTLNKNLSTIIEQGEYAKVDLKEFKEAE